MGVMANALALAWLVANRWLPLRALDVTLAVAWYAAVAIGLHGHTRPIYEQDLPEVRRHMGACQEHVRNYLATGDLRYLDDDNVPYPSAHSFQERIDLPALQAIMPASVRRPLRIETFQPGPFQLHDTQTRKPNYGATPAAAKPTGLAPAVAPLEAARTWGSFGAANAGEFTSVSFRVARRTHLRFRVAGDLGAPGTQLEIQDTLRGATRADIAAATRPGTGWRTAEVSVPAGNLVLRAQNADPRQWFAFSEPVEVAPLSAAVARLVPLGRSIWQLAVAASALLWLWVGVQAWRAGKALPGNAIS
jgi:hypothetical protein